MSELNFLGREKSSWRAELIARLMRMHRDQASGRKSAEVTLLARLEEWLGVRPGLWLSYRGFSLEPRLAFESLRDVNSFAHSFGCSFAYPKIQPDKTLSFFRWTGTDQATTSDWETNRFGIQEPKIKNARSEWTNVDARDPVVGALIPALGFDRQLFRLGRGSGFYDRFLSTFDEERKQLGESPIYKLGIGFSEQLVDELPRDDHDVKLDAVLTDCELIVRCAAARFAD